MAVVVNPGLDRSDELNIFYTRFKAAAIIANAEANANARANAKAEKAFIISEHDVTRAFRRVNTRKAAGPDGISGQVLRACADQLAPMFTEIFNLSLTHLVIPTCFKESIIFITPEENPSCFLQRLPPCSPDLVMKCLERLVKDFIISSPPDTLDLLHTKQERNYQTPVIESPVERVDSFRYLGVHITQDLSWSCHINTVVKKAWQRLYHLRHLRDFRLPSKENLESAVFTQERSSGPYPSQSTRYWSP
ncbi:hypothetical protein QTP70_004125 [Hemibagrus guttatus]|uniref:Alkylated DNA repair protein AlkB homologue 8 N-terminal domain-containing protein n=1 Tax=Hemibagrus guttatus TaxID=175788 RepID=A0AAE0QIF6_9TELE|nr:hypothetical protein QTP70_004125 [Hemibagrus guttatus]